MKKSVAALLSVFLFTLSSISAFAECRVVTLMYHNVTQDESRYDDYTIAPYQLEEDIKTFRENGYILMTASELADADMSSLDNKKILLLTFDDGYIGWYTEVFPILKEYNAKASMYIVGAYINRYGYMSEAQIKEMSDSNLVEFGNHTDHIHQMPLEILKNMYNHGNLEDILMDLNRNARNLFRITGVPVTSITWPYGYSTDYIDRAVKEELGYKISFSTNFGVTRYTGDNTPRFNRINREYSKTSQKILELAESKF